MPDLEPTRCTWATGALDTEYHDHEWGVPVRDERHLFELLTLEGAQAGLSWLTVLQRRPAYRLAFAGFDPAAVAAMDDEDVAALVVNPGIIRHRGKIASTITNAQAYLRVQQEHGSFADYLWAFVDGQPRINAFETPAQVPATTPLSEAMSKDLRRRGFSFVGPTICYAYAQAAGLVMDHLTCCFRWPILAGQ